MKHISDTERLQTAILNKKDQELTKCKRENIQLKQHIETLTQYVSELKTSNQILANQLNYLARKSHLNV